jgi:hypothetical protein
MTFIRKEDGFGLGLNCFKSQINVYKLHTLEKITLDFQIGKRG